MPNDMHDDRPAAGAASSLQANRRNVLLPGEPTVKRVYTPAASVTLGAVMRV